MIRNVSTTFAERYQTEDGNVQIERFKRGLWSVMPRGSEPFMVRSKRAAFEAAEAAAPRVTSDDLDALRRRVRGWVTFRVDAEPEDFDPAEHFEDPEDLRFARSGDLWHWCSVRVRAEAFGLHGDDHLWGCSFHSEDDFTRPWPGGSYYADMCSAALDQLVERIARSPEALAWLAHWEHDHGAPIWGAVLDADDADRDHNAEFLIQRALDDQDPALAAKGAA